MISITNRENNSQVYVKGDYSLVISPFDNYQLFTIYGNDTDKIPINLNNVGDLYLTFKDNKNTVIIKNVSDVHNADKSKGEVLFKISKADGTKILNMTNNVFYISSKFNKNDSTSDETVLFSGKWEDYSVATSQSVSNRLIQLQEQISTLTSNNMMLSDTNLQLTNEISSLNEQINTLKTTIVSLQAELAQYTSSNVITAASLDDYLHALSVKGKNKKLTEDELSKIASSLSIDSL